MKTNIEAQITTNEIEDYRQRPWSGENVLHVYPRTFNEVRHESEQHMGMGSILGITEKLDWIEESGVTAIWLAPIYKSPGLDGNYDISDYREVNEDLGTTEDVDELIKSAHDRDIRVIFDLVPNHTSDQSKWFQASADPSHPKHEQYKDYYIWRDAVTGELPPNTVDGDGRLDGVPDGITVPNNWTSVFSIPQIDKVRTENGGIIPEGIEIPAVTAWVWSPARQQFYLAEFMKQQPSLNMSSKTVRDEIKGVMRFWLDKGVDGYRIDVVNHIGKDTSFSDEDPEEHGTEMGKYNPGVTNPHDQLKQEKLVSHWPQLGNYMTDLLSVIDEYPDRNVRIVLEDWMSALSDDNRMDELAPDRATVFNFEMLLNMNRDRWDATNIGRIAMKYYARIKSTIGAVPNQVTGNHDTDTLRTRLESAAAMRAALMVMGAMPGAFYIWQGDMMGRPNIIVPTEMQQDGDIGQRDGERIPMQWSEDVSGGFTDAPRDQQWLPAVDEFVYRSDNLERQARESGSHYRLVRDLLQLRKNDAALRGGEIEFLHANHDNVLAYRRKDPTNSRRQVLSITNFSAQTVLAVSVLDVRESSAQVILSSVTFKNLRGVEVDLGNINLEPDESILLESIS